MENKHKKILVQLIEECGKLTRNCYDAIHFGLFARKVNQLDHTNGEKILNKYYRIQAIIEVLQSNGVLPTYSRAYIEHIKRDVYNKFGNHRKNKK